MTTRGLFRRPLVVSFLNDKEKLMQPFHTRLHSLFGNEDQFSNKTHVAVDWPTRFEHDGRTYTVDLYLTSKRFPNTVSPTDIHLWISTGKGYSLHYFVCTTAPSWSYREIFKQPEGFPAVAGLPEEHPSVFSLTERRALEETFLSLCTYCPVEVNDWKGESIEEIWNQGNVLQAAWSKREAEAAERDLYGGFTWDEWYNEL